MADIYIGQIVVGDWIKDKKSNQVYEVQYIYTYEKRIVVDLVGYKFRSDFGLFSIHYWNLDRYILLGNPNTEPYLRTLYGRN